jgi:WD40 repeat protein
MGRLSRLCRALIVQAPVTFAVVALVTFAALSPSAAPAENRIALVIGNDRYPNLPPDEQLAKAVNDANSIGDSLERMGFTVVRGLNLDRQGMIDRIFDFAQKIKPGDTAFLFYAGHGVAIGGGNYLLPTDIKIASAGEESRVRNIAISETDIVADIEERKPRVTILVLDACRDNPFRQPGLTRSVGAARGLTRSPEAEGVFAVYSAAFGQAALDSLGPDDKSPNSVFTRVLAPALARPNVHLGDLIIDVREEVAQIAASVHHEQNPAYYDQTRGGRIFIAGRSDATEPTPTRIDPNAYARNKWAGWKLTPQVGHFLPVPALAVSPDGRHIVTGSLDSSIKVWDSGSGQLLGELPSAGPVISLAFSRDGRRIAAACLDTTVRIWDFASGRLLQTIANRTWVASVAFSPDSRRVVAATGTGLRTFDTDSGKSIPMPEGHDVPTFAVAFSPDGRQLVSAGMDKVVKVWDGDTYQLIKTLNGHTGPVVAMSFTPNGSRILTASVDKTVRIWDASRLELEQTLGPHASSVVSLTIAPDGRSLFAGTLDGRIKAWDLPTMHVTQTLDAHPGRPIEVGLVASGLLSGQFSGSISGVASWIISGGLPGALALAYLPEGRVISVGGDKSIKFWDVTNAQLLRTIAGHSDAITSVAFSPDGRHLVSGSADTTVRIWNAVRGELERTLEGHTDAVTSVAVSPDGRRIASASLDNTVRLWSIGTGKVEGTLEGHSDPVMSVAFSIDSRRIVTGSLDNTVRLWDAMSMRLMRTFEGHELPVMAVAFSPDGRRIASGSLDSTVRFWDAASGQLVSRSEHLNAPIAALSYAPDGRGIAVGTLDLLYLLDTSNGHKLATLSPAPADALPDLRSVLAVTFSRDGRRLAAVGANRAVTVWEIGQAEQPGLILNDQAYVATSVAFSPDGRRIASAGFSDKTVRIWNAENGHLLATMMALSPTDYFSVGADGAFNATPGALENLHLTQGLESEPVSDEYKSLFMRERSLDEIAAMAK